MNRLLDLATRRHEPIPQKALKTFLIGLAAMQLASLLVIVIWPQYARNVTPVLFLCFGGVLLLLSETYEGALGGPDGSAAAWKPATRAQVLTFAALIVTATFATLAFAGYEYWLKSKKETLAIQTLGLRHNAERLFAETPIPSRDITEGMIHALAATRSPSPRFDNAMGKLRVDDGFPKTGARPKLFDGDTEVRVVGKDGRIYVHYIGASPRLCEGVAFAICL